MPFRANSGAHGMVGRATQQRRLDLLSAQLKVGRGRAVALTGEPGVGKTALLARMVSRARDATVLATSGLESEAALPFAALGDLLRPLLPRLDELPGPQAAALRSALAVSSGPTDAYALCMGTLTLLTAEAERQPVLVIVDDAGWIDQPSMATLLFVARRVDTDAVALVFGARDPLPPEFAAAGVEELRLGGLDQDGTAELLDRLRPGQVAPGVPVALWSATGGNPLALTELGGSLTDDQLAGTVELPDPLPLGAGLRDAFAARLAPLPAETRVALLTVALAASDDADTIIGALRTLGVDAAAITAGATAHLLTHRGARIELTHPLLRATVRQVASPAERRVVYDALAAVTTGDALAWYRAAELTGPDAVAAADLETAADGMRRRAGFAAAARAMRRSAELTADEPTRVRRVLAAADDAQTSGHLPEAANWLGEALATVADPGLRADLALAYGWVLNRRGTPGAAQAVMTEAAQRITESDPERAAALWGAAVNPALTEGRVREAVGYAQRARSLVDDDCARMLLGQALVVRGRVPEGRRLLDEQRDFVSRLDPLRDAEHLVMVGVNRLWLDQPAEARAVLSRVAAATRRAGALGPLSRALTFTAMVRHTTGDWLIGHAEADEALRLARELRDLSTIGLALVVLARYEAAQGRTADADAHLAEAARLAGPTAVHGLAVLHGSVLGLRNLAAGAPVEAIARLDATGAFAERCGVGNPAVAPWQSDLVEACRLAGRPDRARKVLDELDEHSRAGDLPRTRAAVARHRAALAPDAESAEQWFRRATELYAAHPQPFEEARTGLAYGEALLRHGRRAEAGAVLGEVLVTFGRLGAEPFVRRTQMVLAAIGEPHGPDPASLLARLTPRELQVARAVGDGLSNPEAAAALFVSRKTVETHLSSAYRKLGLRSRTQLVRYLAETVVSGSSRRSERPGTLSSYRQPGELPEASHAHPRGP